LGQRRTKDSKACRQYSLNSSSSARQYFTTRGTKLWRCSPANRWPACRLEHNTNISLSQSLQASRKKRTFCRLFSKVSPTGVQVVKQTCTHVSFLWNANVIQNTGFTCSRRAVQRTKKMCTFICFKIDRILVWKVQRTLGYENEEKDRQVSVKEILRLSWN
jgi:hypothetical protein